MNLTKPIKLKPSLYLSLRWPTTTTSGAHCLRRSTMQPPPLPPGNPFASNASIPPVVISTEQIQKYLEENKQLIMAILENQNLGKLVECAQYQAKLQKNLLFLAAIADAQPQAPTVRPQMMPQTPIHQGGHYIPQAPAFAPRSPLNPQQMQEQQQQQHQFHHQPQMLPVQGHMAMRPGVINGMHVMHADASHGVSGDLPPGPSSSIDGRGGKQDRGSTESGAVDGGHRNSATEQGSGDTEPGHTKKMEDGKTV